LKACLPFPTIDHLRRVLPILLLAGVLAVLAGGAPLGAAALPASRARSRQFAGRLSNDFANACAGVRDIVIGGPGRRDRAVADRVDLVFGSTERGARCG
jgi:hypothetical protein